MNTIPFFYYDIVARIFPGGITLGVLAYALPRMQRLVSGPEAWKTTVVPLTIAAASYMIGVLFEVVSPDWIVWRRISDITFRAAAKDFRWSQEFKQPDLASPGQMRRFREEAWFDLILAGKKDQAQAFAHALRMWAEAKIYLHSLLPVVGAIMISFWRQRWGWTVGATILAGIFLCGVYSPDRRRWVQILHSMERMTRSPSVAQEKTAN